MSTINKVEFELLLKDYLSKNIKEAEGNVKNFEGSLGGLQNSINKIGATIGAAFVINKITDFGKSIIDAGSKVEDATTGLTTLLGDAAKATQVVKNTMEDATKTPFEFEGLLSANQQIIASGVNSERAREDVMNLANAVAASGKGNDEFQRMSANLAQISTVGKATAMDIKQFGIAGINIYKVLADYTNQPIDKVKEMEVSYDVLTKALGKAHEKGGMYYNGLENMQKNTSVQMSNLGDTVFKTMVDIFQKLKPLTDFVLGNVAKGLEFISSKIAALDLKSYAESLINIFNSLVNFITPIIAPIQRLFTHIWEGIRKVWETLSQFSTQGAGVLEFLRSALIYIIDLFTTLYDNFYSFISGVIDVAHTIYVILEKLGIIWVLGKAFELVMSTIRGIGSMLEGIYKNTIKPILDGIGWAYEKLKALLGIKEVKVSGKIEDKEKSIIEQGADMAKSGGMSKMSTSAGISGGGKETSKVTGSKSTTINITIGKLIEEFKVQTTTVGEGASKIKEKVAESLLSAINDSQVVAGI
jgi:tape measure domain-containing protein